MEIKLVGNINITNNMQNYIEKKLDKLARLVYEPAAVHINIDHHGSSYTMDLSLIEGRKTFHIKELGDDPYELFDKILDKLERQIVKNKEMTKVRKSKSSIKKEFEEAYSEAADTSYYVYHINIKPISLQEAIMALEDSDHDFYPFINDERGEVNVIFKRKDGNYGLYIKKNK